MSAGLAAEQQALMAALWHPVSDDAPELIAQYVQPTRTGGRSDLQMALRAYRGNGLGLARRALPAAYPVLARLVGRDAMDALASDFWRRHPPRHGDIARWGDALPVFVRGSAQLSELPWLADVAQAEWAMHVAATAADGVLDAPSFTLLVDQPASQVTLVLSAGATLLRSPWPVAELIGAHAVDDAAARENVTRVLAACVVGGPVRATLVWRQGLRSCCRSVGSPEAGVIDALLQGASLDAALTAQPAFVFDAWLGEAVASGLVLGARRV